MTRADIRRAARRGLAFSSIGPVSGLTSGISRQFAFPCGLIRTVAVELTDSFTVAGAVPGLTPKTRGSHWFPFSSIRQGGWTPDQSQRDDGV